MTAVAGIFAGEAGLRGDEADCRLHLPDGIEVEVTGRFIARPDSTRAIPFRVESGLPDGCRATVRTLWPSSETLPATGVRLRVPARWEARDFPEVGRGEWAGRLRVRGAGEVVPGGDLAGHVIGIRGTVADRIAHLWGPRAPMVEALVLARREHLDPELRGAFGISGTAHLLAISGFHVGVVAGLLLSILRIAGARPRPAALGAAGGSWLYVLTIGAPDAALRASVILSLLALARLRGTPVVSVGTLSTAFLALLVFDPTSLRSVGFQLSFAGTWGLVALRRPLEELLDRGWRRHGIRPPRRRPGAGAGERWLRGSSEGLTAGISATLPTLPLLAWHFDRVSLVGIPATLAVAPGVALAIPGVGLSLLASVPSDALGGFLAGGVGLILALVEWGVRVAAGLPGSSIWVSRSVLLAGGGAALATLLALSPLAGRIRRPARGALAAGAALWITLLLPVLPLPRSMELHMIDVGQGDALLLRLPSGRWIGIDAGPASATWDAGERRVIPYLRRQGVRTLDLLVLSHPHLDHIGGAEAVMEGVRVQGLLDPGAAVPSRPYLEMLEAGRAAGVPLRRAESGLSFTDGGVELEVLHPPPDFWGGTGSDPNDLSVILLVTWGASTVLLTGDAYQPHEEAVLAQLPSRLSVLKVGHHGSRTSTSEALLREARPAWALIPAGDGNRFGHPHPEVVARLESHGVEIVRTDRDGSIRMRLHRSGRVEVRTQR